MNKQTVEKIIDYFADKTLSFGCEVLVSGRIGELINDNGDPEPDELEDCNGTMIDDSLVYCDYRGEVYFTGEDNLEVEIIGHPVMLGDVLEKVHQSKSLSVTKMILNFWEVLGLNKSLNQIAECGYEGRNKTCGETCELCDMVECIKDPNADALFEFLNTLIIKTI